MIVNGHLERIPPWNPELRQQIQAFVSAHSGHASGERPARLGGELAAMSMPKLPGVEGAENGFIIIGGDVAVEVTPGGKSRIIL